MFSKNLGNPIIYIQEVFRQNLMLKIKVYKKLGVNSYDVINDSSRDFF